MTPRVRRNQVQLAIEWGATLEQLESQFSDVPRELLHVWFHSREVGLNEAVLSDAARLAKRFGTRIHRTHLVEVMQTFWGPLCPEAGVVEKTIADTLS